MQNLVEENSKSPHVSFRPIPVIEQAFRRHIDWAADIDIIENFIWVLEFPSESEISNFGNAIAHEDVSHFKIPVNNPHFVEILQARKGFVYDFSSLWLVKRPSFSNHALQVAVIAEISDDVTVVFTGEYLNAVEDVGVFKRLQDFALGLQQLDEGRSLHPLHFHNLDCAYLVWIENGLLVSWLIPL